MSFIDKWFNRKKDDRSEPVYTLRSSTDDTSIDDLRKLCVNLDARPIISTMSDIGKIEKIETKEKEPKVDKDKWIWVEGYKGTDRDMSCRGYQFELGKQYDMPEDAEIETCSSGFHLCLNINDVFNYYEIGDGHRFFKVKALVRILDATNYGTYPRSSYGFICAYPINKLAAKSIEFVEELSIDEIFEPYGLNDNRLEGWSEEYKKIALEIGIPATTTLIHKDKLVELGYSSAFATIIAEDDKRYEVAKAVGSQPGLSMDMKAYLIFKN